MPWQSPYVGLNNDPILNTDPDGDIPPPLIAAAVGAVGGGLLGGGIEYFSQVYGNYKNGRHFIFKGIDGSKVWGATVEGAITGGVAGATGGASIPIQVLGGIASQVIGGGANRAIDKSKNVLDGEEVVTDILVGGTGGFASGKMDKLMPAGGAVETGLIASVSNTVGRGAAKKVIKPIVKLAMKKGVKPTVKAATKGVVGVGGNLLFGEDDEEIGNFSNPLNTYVIKKGDSLSQIAKSNGTTVDSLSRINNIDDANLIRAGDTLTIK
jgi:LysM repeat protein